MIKCISISSEATDLEQMGHLKPARESTERSSQRGQEAKSSTPHPRCQRRARQPLTCCLHGGTHPTQRPPGTRSSCASRQQRRSSGDSHPAGHGRPRARHAEGTESLPRQRTRGQQLLLGLKGRGAAWATQHPTAGKGGRHMPVPGWCCCSLAPGDSSKEGGAQQSMGRPELGAQTAAASSTEVGAGPSNASRKPQGAAQADIPD